MIVCAAGMVSGKEIVSLTLARELRRKGWDVEFITSRWGRPEFRDLLEENGFTHHMLWLGFIAMALRWRPMAMTLDQMMRWPALVLGFQRLLATRRPDVVIHTNWHHALLLAPLLKVQRDIYWSHELLPSTTPYRVVFGLISKRVARVVCVSSAAARSLKAIGVTNRKVTVVHNGTAFDEAIPPPTSVAPLRLGIIGQIASWKGHEDIIEAMAMLSRQGVAVTLKVFGRGDDRFVESLRQLATDLKIADEIEWCGFIADRTVIYGQIDLCVIPSRFEEPFATSALEAGLAGRPVICTAVGGLPEIVLDSVTGILVAPTEPKQLMEAIMTFARHPELVSKMGEAAMTRVKAEFSPDHFGVRFLDVVKSVEQSGGLPE